LSTFQPSRVIDARQLAWSPDDRYLCYYASNYAALIDAREGTHWKNIIFHIWGHEVNWSPDGSRLTVGLEEWDVQTGEQIHRVEHKPWQDIKVGRYHPTEPWLVAGSQAGQLILKDYRKQELLAEINTESEIKDLTWSPDGRFVLAATEGSSLWVLDPREGLRVRNRLHGHLSSALGVDWSPDGGRIASVGADRLIKIWPVSDGDGPTSPPTFKPASGPESTWPELNAEGLGKGRTVSPDGRLLAGFIQLGRNAMFPAKAIGIWRISDGRLLHVLDDHTPRYHMETPLWSPDGQTLLTGGEDTYMTLWDVWTGEILRRFSGHTSSIQAYAFSPDGSRLVSRARNGSLRIWDVDTGTEILEIPCRYQDGIAWSEDGRALFNPADQEEFWDASEGYAIAASADFKAFVDMLEFEDGLKEEASVKAANQLIQLAMERQIHRSGSAMNPVAALRHLDRARALMPHDAKAWRTRGWALRGLEDWAGALKAMDEADTALGLPQDAELFAIRAIAHYGLKDREQGHVWYGQAKQVWETTGTQPSPPILWDLELARLTPEERDALTDPMMLSWASTTEIARGAWESADKILGRLNGILGERAARIVQSGWWTIGPYPAEMNTPWPPEENLDPLRPLELASEETPGPRHWWTSSVEGPHTIFLGRMSDSCFYLLKLVWATTDQEAVIWLSAGGPVRVFSNRDAIADLAPTGRKFDNWHHETKLPLKKGWNKVLLKVLNPSGRESELRVAVTSDP
ncbi:MAG: hypothetical protein AAF492_04165, partial [Verrucomicrobiota bacterium]